MNLVNLGRRSDMWSVNTMCQLHTVSVIQCSFLHRMLLWLKLNICNSIYAKTDSSSAFCRRASTISSAVPMLRTSSGSLSLKAYATICNCAMSSSVSTDCE